MLFRRSTNPDVSPSGHTEEEMDPLYVQDPSLSLTENLPSNSNNSRISASVNGHSAASPGSCRRGFRFKCTVCLGSLILIINLLYLNLIVPKAPLQLPPQQHEPWQLPITRLHALTIFKEESHALIELILHLYSQGVEHIILVDNDSHHALPMEALNLLIEKGIITLRKDARQHLQKSALRQNTQLSRWMGADWLMAVDADEFPYSTQLGSIQNYITLRDEEVCSIASPFLFFGSDGREEQPNSLIHGFVGRGNNTIMKPSRAGYKSIARLSCTMWFAVHHAALIPSYSLRGYNSFHGFARDPSPILDGRTEEVQPDIVINHYRSQSHRFFLDIKQTRGRATNNGKVRDERAFRDSDMNHTIDNALVHKVESRFPSFYSDNLALQSNHDYLSPWPLKNIRSALDELERHQVLVIFDGDNTLPDTLGMITRNAAILDPTLDCIVRIAPGHIQATMNSQLMKFCTVFEAIPETERSWSTFVQAMIQKYQHRYKGFVIVEESTQFQYGIETAPMRRAAIEAKSWQSWKQGINNGGSVQLIGTKSF